MASEKSTEELSQIPGERVSAVLARASQQLSIMAGELSASYEKEINFLNGMMRRDRQLAKLRAKAAKDEQSIRELKELRDRQLKKIWWLESELNRQKTAATATDDEVHQLRTRLKAATATDDEVRQLRARLKALQDSPLGRVQRRYWKLRSRRG